jgi:hypothetical protein
VASGSGGEAPDPGSPRGEGNKRARTTSSTSTSPGDTGRPPRPLITARHASRTAVVSSLELVGHVLSFLGGRRWAVKDLGRAALVCRLWREVAEGEEVWGRLDSDVMPAMGRRVSEVEARRCVLERGLCHHDQRAFVGDRWWGDLRLQVEVWDNLAHKSLLSLEGKMGMSAHPHLLRLTGTDRVEVVSPAFSAASQDPVQRRFASIDDYFRRGPEDTVKGGIGIRVYVRDAWRGRQALLWDFIYRGASEQIQLHCESVPPTNLLRPYLPEGSRRVTPPAGCPSTALRIRIIRAKPLMPVRSSMFAPRRARRGWRRRTRCGAWRGATRTTTATTARSSAWSFMVT